MGHAIKVMFYDINLYLFRNKNVHTYKASLIIFSDLSADDLGMTIDLSGIFFT